MKVEATEVDGRRVYTVRAFNQGVATWLQRLPTVWVEGEVTELRRQARWASVFLTLKDPESGACLAVQMPRTQFDALRLDLVDGERVHVFGRPELYEQRGELRQRALTIDPSQAAAHYHLGDAYNQTDRLADALEAYEAAARLQPDHWRALKGMGVILDRLGRPEEATVAYQRAREAQRR